MNLGPSSWTPERTEQAVAMWKDGKSAAQIARKLGNISRHAVIGKLHRMGMNERYQPSRLAYGAPPRPVRAAALPKSTKARPDLHLAGNGAVFEEPEAREPLQPPPPTKTYLALPGTTPLHFTKRPARGCKWPIYGEGDDDGIARHVCCEPRDGDGPYCPAHHAIGMQPQSATAKKGNDLARSLRRHA